MRNTVRQFATVLGLLALSVASAAPASAQQKRAPAAPAQKAAPQAQPAPPAPQFKEVALTDKQVEGALAAQKDMDAIAAKIPQPKGNQPPKPDPAILAQFEDAAKKNGFASYAEYNEVVATIGMVMGGFDPKTKSYIGPEAALKQQIAALQADKTMPAKEKKAALGEMNAALKSPPPAIQNQANIDLVTKYYDKLAAVMQAE